MHHGLRGMDASGPLAASGIYILLSERNVINSTKLSLHICKTTQ